MVHPLVSDDSRRRVAVFGSVNLDHVYQVDVLPLPGETIRSSGVTTGLGGKGANQAVAAVRAGAEVTMLGALGTDGFAARVLASLSAAGVDTDGLVQLPGARSGSAMIVVDGRGQNFIVVSSAANALVSPADAARVATSISEAAVLVVQGELNAEATSAAIRIADANDVRVIVNLAPCFELGAELAVADPLVVNEVEAGQLLGTVIGGIDDVRAAAGRLLALCRSAVVTLGAQGAAIVEAAGVSAIPAPSAAVVVDTTGAGDAFVGVLAACLAAGVALEPAVRGAVDAATLSVQSRGAADAYPDFRRFVDEPVRASS